MITGEAARRPFYASWSTRRRWFVLVLVPTFLVCCCGAPAAGGAFWLLRTTIEASRGAASPDAAASEYLMGLGYDNEDGLLPLFDNERQDELLDQWRTYRADMERTDPALSRFDFGTLVVNQVDADHARVSTEVTATWWSTNGGGMAYDSDALPWRFETREDNGWQITAVEPPAWCGGYVRPDACT
jgi:hypothetical protein